MRDYVHEKMLQIHARRSHCTFFFFFYLIKYSELYTKYTKLLKFILILSIKNHFQNVFNEKKNLVSLVF